MPTKYFLFEYYTYFQHKSVGTFDTKLFVDINLTRNLRKTRFLLSHNPMWHVIENHQKIQCLCDAIIIIISIFHISSTYLLDYSVC